jgi:DNA end-binding protein Ku
VFDHIGETQTDPEMVKLARQLIDRQTGTYAPADVEDRYETRLRALIEAKLKGEALAPEDEAEADRSNVVDLMAALKKSLAQGSGQPAAAKASAPAAPKAKSAKSETPKKPARRRA